MQRVREEETEIGRRTRDRLTERVRRKGYEEEERI